METKLNPLQQALLNIQRDLKAPKNRFNAFGKYNYRDAEGILEAVKPMLAKEGVLLLLSDDIEEVGGRLYVVATVQLQMGEANITVYGRAREEESKKGMDGSQVTGASSSYARKYGLNGMFLIDDSQDSDSTNDGSQPAKTAAKAKTEKPAEAQAAAAPATTAKKALEINTKGFEGAVQWVASTEGLIFDVIDQLKTKYTLSEEVEKALGERAAAIRGAK